MAFFIKASSSHAQTDKGCKPVEVSKRCEKNMVLRQKDSRVSLDSAKCNMERQLIHLNEIMKAFEIEPDTTSYSRKEDE